MPKFQLTFFFDPRQINMGPQRPRYLRQNLTHALHEPTYPRYPRHLRTHATHAIHAI